MNNFNYINGKMVNNKILDSENNVFSKRKRRDENVVIKKILWCMFSSSLAFAGAGTATATSGDTSENKSKSSIFFWSVVISIIGLIATVWFLSGDCTTCVSEGNSRGRRTGSMVCSSSQR